MKEWYWEVYLKSQHWYDLRWKKLNSVNRKCEKCRALKGLDVHHLDYRDIYDVELTDLQVLCRRCHLAEHHPELKKALPKRSKKKGRKKKRKDKKPSKPRRKKNKKPLVWKRKSKAPHVI